MLVYCNHPTSRFNYISTYILETLCGIEISVTDNEEEFRLYTGPSLCYNDNAVNPLAFHIIPNRLVFDQGIESQEITMQEWCGLKIFFCTQGRDIPFDILSASFYLISRYEEYLPQEKDMYGRYDHRGSFAAKNNVLHLPLVNCWAMELRKLLLIKFPSLLYKRSPFQFLPTYDIDMAWTYLHKGFFRNVAGFTRSVINRQWMQVVKRLDVLTKKRSDPFDVYEFLDALHLRYSLRPHYFFLLAENAVGYDTNISPSHHAMKDLVAYHSAGYHVGIHPSWQSGDRPELLKQEINSLETINRKKVTASRFHYIRFDLPSGYRKLIREGITDDFSMGYGDINGFRASVTTPFHWYDLQKDEQTNLTVHPFCWMDANSYYEQQYTPAQAYLELKSMHDIIRSVEGEMSIILHNSFLSDEPEFEGWKNLYEIFLDEVVYWDI